MDEIREMDKGSDELILPGFRFHPTDEELVGFYLKRKIQRKPLSIELIRQLDIYKYDPWDLPKLATTGEKESYFYCLRDRKYRNSARPNRVTGAGFWKATGTDRPIYSSEGTKCIGLKKSLVFYKGRAARGIKTDWMMHEFRLPSLTDSSLPRKPLDRNIPANESWAICRIFKKTNSIAHRALTHSWIAPFPERTESDMFSVLQTTNCSSFGSENISCTTTEAGSAIQFGCNNGLQQQDSIICYSPLDVTTYKPVDLINCRSPLLPISSTEMPHNFMPSHTEVSMTSKGTVDVASLLLNRSTTTLEDVEKLSVTIDFGQLQQCNGPGTDLPLDISEHSGSEEGIFVINTADNTCNVNNNQWATLRSINFPFNLPSDLSDEWKFSSLPWDSHPFPSEMSPSYSKNICYT